MVVRVNSTCVDRVESICSWYVGFESCRVVRFVCCFGILSYIVYFEYEFRKGSLWKDIILLCFIRVSGKFDKE